MIAIQAIRLRAAGGVRTVRTTREKPPGGACPQRARCRPVALHPPPTLSRDANVDRRRWLASMAVAPPHVRNRPPPPP